MVANPVGTYQRLSTVLSLGTGSDVLFNRLAGQFTSVTSHQSNPSPFTIGLVNPYARQVATTKVAAITTPNSLSGSSSLVPNTPLAVGPLNTTNTGSNDSRANLATGRNISPQDLTEADRNYVEQIDLQSRLVSAFPVLTLLAAPTTISKSMEPTVETAKGRRGPIVSQWLERPMVLQASGRTLAQMIVTQSGGGGLTSGFRTYSDSYNNLLNLFAVYKNNGLLFTQAGAQGTSSTGVAVYPVAVQIRYGGSRYIGSFDSFSIKESAETPFLLNYDFTFTVRAEYADY